MNNELVHRVARAGINTVSCTSDSVLIALSHSALRCSSRAKPLLVGSPASLAKSNASSVQFIVNSIFNFVQLLIVVGIVQLLRSRHISSVNLKDVGSAEMQVACVSASVCLIWSSCYVATGQVPEPKIRAKCIVCSSETLSSSDSKIAPCTLDVRVLGRIEIELTRVGDLARSVVELARALFASGAAGTSKRLRGHVATCALPVKGRGTIQILLLCRNASERCGSDLARRAVVVQYTLLTCGVIPAVCTKWAFVNEETAPYGTASRVGVMANSLALVTQTAPATISLIDAGIAVSSKQTVAHY